MYIFLYIYILYIYIYIYIYLCNIYVYMYTCIHIGGPKATHHVYYPACVLSLAGYTGSAGE